MKKSLLWMIALILLLAAFHGIAEDAYEAAAMLSAYTGNEEIATVPAELQGLPVTAIGDGCFAETGVHDLTLPDTVTSIGEYAFWLCPLKPFMARKTSCIWVMARSSARILPSLFCRKGCSPWGTRCSRIAIL